MRYSVLRGCGFAALIACFAMVGCDAGKSKDTKPKKDDSTETESADKPEKKTKPAKVDPSEEKELEAAGDKVGEDADPNKPPTTAEWDAQKDEVTVRGSSALGCETKMVRTWLRISCRGKNNSGGSPTSVNITKGGGDGKTFKFAAGGVTSLVLPFVEGVDVKAQFGWSNKSAELHVFWPRGAPEPPPKGIFTVR